MTMEGEHMEKYKMLATGNNDLIIDDLFTVLRENFDVLCCTHRFDDRMKHIDLFNPHIFVICLNDETVEEIKAFSDLKRKLTSMDVCTVVIGKTEELEMFDKYASQVADLYIKRPTTAEIIKETILEEIRRIEKEMADQEIIRKKLEELKKSDEKKHVLVVDDDPLMLKLIKEYLGDKYNVGTAISGKIAHKFLEAKSTNLILLDYEMPEENGFEVLTKIRDNEKLATIPVVFLTGVTDKLKLLEVLQLKPQGYLLKPIDKEKLLGTIEKLIG